MRTLRLAVITMSLALTPVALAGTDTDSLDVTASVENSCLITGGTLAFGVYDTLDGSAVDASTTISVECTTGAVADITLGQGANADTGSSDAVPLRRLTDGASHLSYFLYSDSDRLVAWGNTEATGKEYTAASNAAANQIVYGRLSSNQDVAAGSFTDTVVATITF